MNRRDFLTASAATGLALVAAPASSAAADPAADRQLFELRHYTFASLDKLKAFEAFLKDAMIPALGRAGVGPVGAFKLLQADNAKAFKEDPAELYVLLPFKSMEAMLTLETKLAADDAYQAAGKAILTAAKADPAFARYEGQLMLAFDGAPVVQAPAKGDERLFQLRIYESHSQERALKKIEMFTKGGEIAIFRKVGLNWVFFGQSLAGTKLPNLTYMCAFDDKAAMDKAWAGFRADPDWQKLSKDESYKDTVSTITNLVLRPAAGSQI